MGQDEPLIVVDNYVAALQPAKGVMGQFGFDGAPSLGSKHKVLRSYSQALPIHAKTGREWGPRRTYWGARSIIQNMPVERRTENRDLRRLWETEGKERALTHSSLNLKAAGSKT